jgi:hypothetical protein
MPRPRLDGHAAFPPSFEHVGDGGLVGIEDAVEVDLHHLVKVGGGLFEERLLPAQDAGAADEDVEPAKVYFSQSGAAGCWPAYPTSLLLATLAKSRTYGNSSSMNAPAVTT